MVLEVLVATVSSRLTQAWSLLQDVMPGVTYLFAVQVPHGAAIPCIPTAIRMRGDIRMVCTRGIGLSANRNVALTYAQGDVLLLADDDVRHSQTAYTYIRHVFSQNPKVDIATFQFCTHQGKLLKDYPSDAFDYAQIPRGMYFSSVEIALRRGAPYVSFDTRFGLHSFCLNSGEEEVFLYQSYRQGCCVRYFPHVIGHTMAGTTGTTFAKKTATRRSKGAVLCMLHGPLGALLRCLRYAWLQRCAVSPLRSLLDMCQGIYYIYHTANASSHATEHHPPILQS